MRCEEVIIFAYTEHRATSVVAMASQRAGSCNEDDFQIDACGGVAYRRGDCGSDIRDGGV
jgi:hypothetical protein